MRSLPRGGDLHARRRASLPLVVAATLLLSMIAPRSVAVKANATLTPLPPGLSLSLLTPRLGIYNGMPHERPDENSIATFGDTPDVASSYYQPKQSVALAYEEARINRGTSPNITITTKGTQLLAGIANGNASALAWLDNYISALATLSRTNLTVPVYATLDHEFVPKVKQKMITGASAEPAVYAKALSVFFTRAKAAAPNLRATYWMAGSNRALEGSIANQLTVKPDYFLFDPYATKATDTVTSIASPEATWIRSQSWYSGQPIALSEFGMPVRLGATALRSFYTGVRDQLSSAGIAWAVLFNCDNGGRFKITTGAYPGPVSAFAASMAAEGLAG